jgi:hypothetical protein
MAAQVAAIDISVWQRRHLLQATRAAFEGGSLDAAPTNQKLRCVSISLRFFGFPPQISVCAIDT